MLTIFVEIIMGVFIANFKASEHPVINIVVRAYIFMFIGFFLVLFSSITDDWDFSISFTLLASLIIGFIVSFFIYLIDAFFNYIDRSK